jgi:hypothetical protein
MIKNKNMVKVMTKNKNKIMMRKVKTELNDADDDDRRKL